MVIKSLKINTKTDHDWNDIIYIFDIDVKLIKTIQRETKIGLDIYYIGYMFTSEDKINTIKPFYGIINRLLGHIGKIEGSNARYLVVSIDNYQINDIFKRLWKYIEDRMFATELWKFVEEKQTLSGNDGDNKITEYNKLRFSSDIDLPLNKIIEFRVLTIHISCVIKKDDKYYPEIYLDEALYVQNIK